MSEETLLSEISELRASVQSLQTQAGSDFSDDFGPQGSRGLAPDWFDAADSGGLDLSNVALGYKINPAGDNPDLVRIYAGEIDRVAVAQTDLHPMLDNYYVYVRRTIVDNTMYVTMAASFPANDATYNYYRLYRFTVASGVASILNIYRPFDIETSLGFTGTVTVITSMAFNTPSLQYKTKLLTYTNGSLTSIGAESGWITLFTAVTGCP